VSVAFRRESDEEHLEPRFERPVPPGPNPVTPRGLHLIEAAVQALEAGPRDEAATRDLRYWRQRLATAEVMPAHGGDEAGFGARVRFRRGGTEQVVRIVGHDEAEAGGDGIGFAAPLARALMGAGEGDVVRLGRDAIEVLGVGEDA